MLFWKVEDDNDESQLARDVAVKVNEQSRAVSPKVFANVSALLEHLAIWRKPEKK